MKKCIFYLFTFFALPSFAQIEYVYSNDRTVKELERIMQYPLMGNELIRVDSMAISSLDGVKSLGLVLENDIDRKAFDSNPFVYKDVVNLYIGCKVPSNIFKFENVRTIAPAYSELCGLGDLHLFMSDSILSLKNLRTISFRGGSPWHIYEQLGSLPNLKEFNCTVQFLPFSILTNKSVKQINGSGTHPELEMFRQLGFKTGISDYFANEKFKLPYSPVDQLKKRKIEKGKLELHYLNGNKLVVGELVSGELDGKWQLWYPDETLCETRHYTNGIPSGQWQFFKENGDTLAIIDYQNGNPHLLTLIDHVIDSVGQVEISGRTEIKDFINPYKAHSIGVQIRKHKNYSTQLTFENLGMRIVDRKETTRNSEGTVIFQSTFQGYNDDDIDMPRYHEVQFYDNGQKKEEVYWMEFWVDTEYGKSHTKGYHGIRRKWDESGNLILEEVYEFGEKVG